jgi:hypothetical protein
MMEAFGKLGDRSGVFLYASHGGREVRKVGQMSLGPRGSNQNHTVANSIWLRTFLKTTCLILEPSLV